MPCSDGGYDYNDGREEVQKIHKLTRMLCALCELVESSSDFDNACEHIPGLVKWWNKHKEEDRLQRERERKAQEVYEEKLRAYKRLTPKQRELLGVKEPKL